MATIDLRKEHLAGGDEALKFLRRAWGKLETRDPVEIVVALGTYCHDIEWPRPYQKKDRKAVVRVWAPCGQKIKEERIVGSQKVDDPVARALTGTFFYTDLDKDVVDGVDEAIVFQAALAFWYVARKYRLLPGRASKAQSARYAFKMLREWRARK